MICLVTDRRRMGVEMVVGSGLSRTPRLPDAVDRLVELVAAAACAGIDLIQIRERDLETRQLTVLVRRCVDGVRGTRAKVLVNDRADVALAAGADGVHLRSDSVDAAAVRTLLPPGAFVGRSVHGAEQAAAVSREGTANYLIIGTMFPTASKDAAHPLTTLDELSAACRASAVPVLAIGGVTLERAALLARAGASGVAGIGLFIPPPGESPQRHLERVVAGLRRVFDTCGAVT